MHSTFRTVWDEVERSLPRPRYLREIVSISFDAFRAIVYSCDPQEIRTLVASIYAGDVYVLERGIAPEFLAQLRSSLFGYGRAVPPSVHRIADGCPDFHTVVDVPVGPPGGYVALDHSYYFFRSNGDPLGIFAAVRDQWEVIKVLSGNAPHAFVGNTPADGVVDRVQAIHYPAGAGLISPHSDPPGNQKVIFGAEMTQRGVDFQSGGFFVFDKNRNKRYVEDEVRIGGFVCAYPTMIHGVDVVDAEKKADWGKIDGRWYLAMNSVYSHHVKDRPTALPASSAEVPAH